jgi:hypothetical protein
MNAIPDSAGQNLVELRFIAVSILKTTYWMPAERPRLRRVTCRQVLLYEDLLWFQNFSPLWAPEWRRYYSSGQERRFHGRAR